MDFLTPSIPFIQKLQTLSWLTTPMKLVTLLGNEEFFLLLLPIIYWLINRRLGAKLGVLLLVSVCLNDIFKVLFHLPRPYWSKQVAAIVTEKSFGFPSGHAQNAALLWPFIALQSKNKKLWLPLSLGLIALICLSRVYLGVHYPLDILGGLILGFGSLLFFVTQQGKLVRLWHSQKWVLAFALPAIYGLLFWAICKANAITDVVTLQGGVSRAAALFGLLIGLSLVPAFDVSESTLKKAIRFIVGMVGLAFFYFGLKKVLPDENIFRFARYFLTTFWVTFGAPMLFLKLGLAQLEKTERPVD